jgi:addiction module RelB/DinJ family antitoxin
MNTTIQIRVDSSTKARAIKAFKNIGLDLSSGIKFLLTQVSNPNNTDYVCPFGFMHKYTPKMFKQYEKEVQHTLKHGKGYLSTRKMFDDILS